MRKASPSANVPLATNRSQSGNTQMRVFLPKLRNRVNMTETETSYIQVYGLMKQRKSTKDVYGKKGRMI